MSALLMPVPLPPSRKRSSEDLSAPELGTSRPPRRARPSNGTSDVSGSGIGTMPMAPTAATVGSALCNGVMVAGCVMGTPCNSTTPPQPIPGPVMGIPSLPYAGAGFVPMPPHVYLMMQQQQQMAMASCAMAMSFGAAGHAMPGMPPMGMFPPPMMGGMPAMGVCPMPGLPAPPGGMAGQVGGIPCAMGTPGEAPGCSPFSLPPPSLPWAPSGTGLLPPLETSCMELGGKPGAAIPDGMLTSKASGGGTSSPKADSSSSSQDCLVDFEFASFIDSFLISSEGGAARAGLGAPTPGSASDLHDAAVAAAAFNSSEPLLDLALDLPAELGELLPGATPLPTPVDAPLGLTLSHDAVLDALALTC